MKIIIGSDHGGFKLKEGLIKFLQLHGHEITDAGTFSEEGCDYPLIGYQVAKKVSSRTFSRGILVCKTGIGMSMVANKVSGIRAALCDNVKIARSSREHNDANILVLASNIVSPKKAKAILKAWLNAPSPVGRHRRRVNQIKRIDRGRSP